MPRTFLVRALPIVERTIAWLNRCRRLAKGFENRLRYALAFILLASILLMVRKLSIEVLFYQEENGTVPLIQ